MSIRNLRNFLIGAVSLTTTGLILASLSNRVSESNPAAHLTRALDSFAIHMLAGAVLGIVLLVLLRARLLATVLLIAGALVALPILKTQISQSDVLSADAQADLRVIWFNALWSNGEGLDETIDAVNGSGADIVVLSESRLVGARRAEMEEVYPYQLGCIVDCEILILSKSEFVQVRFGALGPLYQERLGQITLSLPDMAPVTLTAAHMVKPWYIGIAESEDHVLREDMLAVDGPQVLIGDFNAAPWSRRMTRFARITGMRTIRRPFGTWPVALGKYGLPIDQVWVGGGARVVSVQPWGEELGSNHVGLNVAISLPASAEPQPVEVDGNQ